jgi:hypothetical protein
MDRLSPEYGEMKYLRKFRNSFPVSIISKVGEREYSGKRDLNIPG